MKLTNNRLKQLIKEVLEEASKDAPFGPFTSQGAYVRSQRAANLSPDQTKKLNALDKDFPHMSRVMDQTLGIDNPDLDIPKGVATYKHIADQHQEYRDIIANQRAGYFSEKGSDPFTKVNTPIGDAYRIGTWKVDKYSGGVFANKTGVYVLDDDGGESYFSPKGPPDPGKKGYKLIPITRTFNENTFISY